MIASCQYAELALYVAFLALGISCLSIGLSIGTLLLERRR